MTKTSKDYLAEANAIVPRLSAEEGIELNASGEAVFIDLRDSNSLRQTGKVAGAYHVPRGMIELSADPESAYYKPFFQKHVRICLVCGGGLMAAMAGRTLIEMGYDNVVNVGGTNAWKEAGGPTEPYEG